MPLRPPQRAKESVALIGSIPGFVLSYPLGGMKWHEMRERARGAARAEVRRARIPPGAARGRHAAVLRAQREARPVDRGPVSGGLMASKPRARRSLAGRIVRRRRGDGRGRRGRHDRLRPLARLAVARGRRGAARHAAARGLVHEPHVQPLEPQPARRRRRHRQPARPRLQRQRHADRAGRDRRPHRGVQLARREPAPRAARTSTSASSCSTPSCRRRRSRSC